MTKLDKLYSLFMEKTNNKFTTCKPYYGDINLVSPISHHTYQRFIIYFDRVQIIVTHLHSNLYTYKNLDIIISAESYENFDLVEIFQGVKNLEFSTTYVAYNQLIVITTYWKLENATARISSELDYRRYKINNLILQTLYNPHTKFGRIYQGILYKRSFN